MKYDTVITNGRVVTAERTFLADVGIRGEKIVAVDRHLAAGAHPRTTVVDAAGRYVVPGGVDVHVHLDLPVAGTVTADDYDSGTRMAACGGVTTVIDFATPGPGQSLRQALDTWHAKAAGRACVDYAFHMTLTNLARQAREVPRLIEAGVPTFKQYTVYARQGLQSSDADIFATLELLRDAGGMLLLHAESPDILDLLVRRHHTRASMKRGGAHLHAVCRPNVVEAEAVTRAIHWARATRGPLYFVHLSTAEAVESVRRAQAEGLSIWAETCPHYLVLDARVFERPDGHLYATSPQVRGLPDRRQLWRGLHSGTLCAVATDTCSFTRRQKDRWGGDFTRIPMGLPGLETLLPIVYTHGVLGGRLTMREFVARCCTNPARVMGLYPRKGTLQPGSDADVVIIHPTRRRSVDWRRMHSRCDWNPYQGWRLAGFAEHAFCRGRQVVQDYAFVGRPGFGVFIPRSRSGG